MKKYFEKKIQESIRECPNLCELGNTSLNNWHTMGFKLIAYVSGKFTQEQTEFIEDCLLNGKPIQVHGVHEQHLSDCLRENQLRQVPFANGQNRLGRKHASEGEKLFNYERPFFVNTENEEENPVVLFISFPSREYLSQTAELLFAFIKLNLQLCIYSNKLEEMGMEDLGPSKFSFSPDKASSILKTCLSREQISQVYYPVAFDAFEDWSGLTSATESGLILKGDIVLIGYVDKVRDLLKTVHGFTELSDGKNKGFVYFGPMKMFGTSVLISENENRRIVLLGLTHSFWGRTAARIAGTCIKAGASHLVYVAKAGTRVGNLNSNRDDPSKHYLCVIGEQYLIWEGNKENPIGKVREVKLRTPGNKFASYFTRREHKENFSRSHISVPTVVGEDYQQLKSYGQFNPSTIDNEISYIAEEISIFEEAHPDEEISLSCIHFITDLVVSNLNIESSFESGLDKDNLLIPEKSQFWDDATEELASFVSTHGVENKIKHLNFNRDAMELDLYFDRFNSDKWSISISELFDHEHRWRETLSQFKSLDGQGNVLQAVLSCTDGEKLLISGEAGSGKSVLAENLFNILRVQYEGNHFRYHPYYFDITSFEKAIILEGKDPERIFQEVVERMDNAIQRHGPLLIIFDGVDDLSPFKPMMIDYLQKEVDSDSLKNSAMVFFSRTYRNRPIATRKVKLIQGVDIGVSKTFYVGPHAIESGIVETSNENLEELLILTSGASREVASELINRISLWPEFSANLRLLNLVLEFETNNKVQFSNPSDFFQMFANEYLKKYSPNMDIGILKDLAAESSYRFLVEGIIFPLDSPEQHLAKRLATQSTEMLCYLAARHLDKTLFESDNYNEERVFPHLINKYSKDLIGRRDQKLVLEMLTKILNAKASGFRLKAFISYLLGRITDENIKPQAITVLLAARKNLETESIDRQEDRNGHLLYDRSVNISLIYLGEPSRDYLASLMHTREKDAINRGFHLAYYGDFHYFSDPDMVIEDDGHCTFERSATSLKNNLDKEGIGSNLLNLSAYTLYSLAISRFLNRSNREFASFEELVEFAENGLLDRSELHDEVRQFIRNCLIYFKANCSPDEYAFSQVSKLKRHPRTGWNDKKNGRKIVNPESVFSHIGSTVYLAVAYLPETDTILNLVEQKDLPSLYSSYCKNTIIRMLAVHDISEYEHGDVASPYKTETDKENEIKAMKFLSILSQKGTSETVVKFSEEILPLWSEFEEEISLNAKIAREIDHIECLAQLTAYAKEKSVLIPDYENFKDRLEASVATEIGRQLLVTLT